MFFLQIYSVGVFDVNLIQMRTRDNDKKLTRRRSHILISNDWNDDELSSMNLLAWQKSLMKMAREEEKIRGICTNDTMRWDEATKTQLD